jgi:hypothetical protein
VDRAAEYLRIARRLEEFSEGLASQAERDRCRALIEAWRKLALEADAEEDSGRSP